MADRNSFQRIFRYTVILLIVLACSFASFDALAQTENLIEHDMSLMGLEEQKPVMMLFQCMYAIALTITYPI